MRLSNKKINDLENVFRLHEQENLQARSPKKANSADENTLLPIMDFIRSDCPMPESLIKWLAQLGLLYGVPYHHLVVDERMVSDPEAVEQKRPVNVIRFFYIDMKWVDSMIDGALSIGTHNSKDFRLQQAFHKAFRPHIENEMLSLRANIKGKATTEEGPQTMGTLAGFILRSPLVLQWPGIEIRGYNKTIDMVDFGKPVQEMDDQDAIMHVLRMERLSLDTMLMIFKGVPECILIKEPAEGIYTGVNYNDKGIEEKESNESTAPYEVVLRHIRDKRGEKKIGQPLIKKGEDAPITSTVPFRAGSERVIDVKGLKGQLQKILKEVDELDKKNKKDIVTPKDMGVLLINSPRYYFLQEGAANK